MESSNTIDPATIQVGDSYMQHDSTLRIFSVQGKIVLMECILQLKKGPKKKRVIIEKGSDRFIPRCS